MENIISEIKNSLIHLTRLKKTAKKKRISKYESWSIGSFQAG